MYDGWPQRQKATRWDRYPSPGDDRASLFCNEGRMPTRQSAKTPELNNLLASSFDTLCLWGFFFPKFSQDHSGWPSGGGRLSGTEIRPRLECWPLQLLDHDADASKEAMSAESVRELWPVRDQLCVLGNLSGPLSLVRRCQ